MMNENWTFVHQLVKRQRRKEACSIELAVISIASSLLKSFFKDLVRVRVIF